MNKRTVVITGANGNLGSVVVETFLGKGYKVIATVFPSASTHSISHPDLEVHAVDLSKEGDTEKFVEEVLAEHTCIDAVLMLAGGFAMGNIANTTAKELQQQLTLNFQTAFNIAGPIFRSMKQKGYGRLIFIGSRAALHAGEGKDLLAYGLSKSLLFKFASYLNEEAKGTNVVASVVVPGVIDTAANRSAMPDIDPAGWVKPEELASLFDFICSDKSLALREPVLKMYGSA
jgi:NAD(P)-dependent dehydrogenase (short-subunit alcohol dehydrogenase family)